MLSAASTKVWDSEEISRALGIYQDNFWEATGVSIDSRSTKPGDLFIAIKGPNNDGHNYLSEVARAGAAAAVVHHENKSDTLPLIKVNNTKDTLYRMAYFARARTNAKILAITGSVGKTGTKEMLRLMLSSQGAVSASAGNLNNEWGLPLSLARMAADVQFGVFEIGMSAPGEVGDLSKIAMPDVSIITAVEYAHSAYFSSINDIASAKAEIVSGMKPDGLLILNRDSKFFEKIKSIAAVYGVTSIKTFGKHPKADFKLIDATREQDLTHIKAELDGVMLDFKIGIHGQHWAINALAALAAVKSLGGDLVNALEKLATAGAVAGRGQSHKIQIQGGYFTLIDESYNANPASMRAAMHVLSESPVGRNGRRIAVLGDMLELGVRAAEFHEELSDPIRINSIDMVFLVGTEMAKLWRILPESLRGGYAETVNGISSELLSSIRAGDVIMIKGSSGTKMRNLVEDVAALQALYLGTDK